MYRDYCHVLFFPEERTGRGEDSKEGIRHITVESEELEIEGFCTPTVAISARKNYLKNLGHCHKRGSECSSNMDDNGDYRPGLQAVAELEEPAAPQRIVKADIRALSKDLGLPTWEKQSFACLSSRFFVYGETITKEKLGMVDKAEQLLLDLGFHQLRVRIHGTLARIEVKPDEFQSSEEPQPDCERTQRIWLLHT